MKRFVSLAPSRRHGERWLRHTLWFNRAVLAAATMLMTSIGLRGLLDPVDSSAQHAITLGSAAGVTVARVGFGGFPLAVAIILLGCVVAERRLLTGLAVLAVVAVVIAVARLLGLVLDGAAPFTVRVLKPELALILASTSAFFFERSRRKRKDGQQGGPPPAKQRTGSGPHPIRRGDERALQNGGVGRSGHLSVAPFDARLTRVPDARRLRQSRGSGAGCLATVARP